MKRVRVAASTVAADVFHALCSREHLCPDTLTSGQAFRWLSVAPSLWRGPLGRRLYTLRFDADEVRFRFEPQSGTSVDTERAMLRDYFRLDVDLTALRREWEGRDSAFPTRGPAGIRQLRQDPWECLLSFICSQNNNIARIGSMIEALCTAFGDRIQCEEEGSPAAFPTLEQLLVATEEQLRALGFGYRAPYIVGAARWVRDAGGTAYLHSLRTATLDQCRAALTQIGGVGLKVADCVALFSLDQRSCVPIDTHVWQIAKGIFFATVCVFAQRAPRSLQRHRRRQRRQVAHAIRVPQAVQRLRLAVGRRGRLGALFAVQRQDQNAEEDGC